MILLPISALHSLRKEDGSYEKKELKELYQMMFPDYPDIVTTPQLQKMLGISRRLVYQLIGDGPIPGILIGNTYKIPKAGVINYFMTEGGDKHADSKTENR